MNNKEFEVNLKCTKLFLILFILFAILQWIFIAKENQYLVILFGILSLNNFIIYLAMLNIEVMLENKGGQNDADNNNQTSK